MSSFFKSFMHDEAKMRQTSDKVFDQVDADKSGKLNKADLTAAAKLLVGKIPGAPEVPASAIDKIIKDNDADHDGELSKDEFFAFSKKFLSKLPF